ncbi:hypothetical protein BZA05DRAFT_382340 [Tricharina praecox]|uniref:uncharacterized protein n=1 Tax=Tricharina praecox TaxID=43433 RepID=UPI00221E963C|nr:uncharacterized protein BZA05DRAFT_382340 [Tricharina praecox]KAI5858753.1 hypothetical protein BZA05DRAFT_382340 [Tricharina praecox]
MVGRMLGLRMCSFLSFSSVFLLSSFFFFFSPSEFPPPPYPHHSLSFPFSWRSSSFSSRFTVSQSPLHASTELCEGSREPDLDLPSSVRCGWCERMRSDAAMVGCRVILRIAYSYPEGG